MLEQKSKPEKIEIIETRSISQEAFINLGDESNHENVCPDDVLFRVLKAIANEKETEIIDQKGEDSETYDLDTPPVKECFLIEKPDFFFFFIQKCKEEPLDPWEEQSFQEILNSGLDSQITSIEFNTENENDPEKNWCTCEKTENDCVMINCGTCLEWFHGSFVGISVKKEKEMKILVD